MGRVLIGIAEDHAAIRKMMINEVKEKLDCEIIAEAGNGIDFLNELKLSNQIPDIVSIDLSMPIMNGYDTIKEIKSQYPSTKILVFTFVAELDAIVNLFNIGIHGFVGKADEKLNFSSAIIEILEHGFLKNKYYRSKQLASLDWNKYSFIGNNAFTYKEIEFIQFNIDNLSTVEIAKLWFCSEKNVEYHRKKIYTKLDITTRQELVTYAKKIGYEY